MSKITRRILRNSKRRIESRLGERNWPDELKPMFSATNIHYEVSVKSRALDAGGIGVIHRLAQSVGLVDEIDRRLHLLKVHKPYHESDHVLNIAYNILSGGENLEDMELRRNNEVYLDALGAQRTPDPTTAGDFCRRFSPDHVETLMEAINHVRLRVWKKQPKAFFNHAVIDVDGVLTETTGECKEGMDISFKGTWGFHPLVVSLANTGEPLYLVNRSGNRPSHEGAAKRLEEAVKLCRQAGFQSITLRGDTDFSQTRHLDRWHAQGVRFIFGIDGSPRMIQEAECLPEEAWRGLERAAKYDVKTTERQKLENVKDRIVRQRFFKTLRQKCEDVAEFLYRPVKCKKAYRVVVVRKNISVEMGEWALFDEMRYLFYITSDEKTEASRVVFEANERCNQENLIAQLKNGVRALHAPVDNLTSNWAYMVMASLSWTLKAWFALLLPEKGRWKEKYRAEKEKVLRMEFKTFLNAFMRVPAQIIRQGRKVIYRFLCWNPWQPVFFRLVDELTVKLRC